MNLNPFSFIARYFEKQRELARLGAEAEARRRDEAIRRSQEWLAKNLVCPECKGTDGVISSSQDNWMWMGGSGEVHLNYCYDPYLWHAAHLKEGFGSYGDITHAEALLSITGDSSARYYAEERKKQR